MREMEIIEKIRRRAGAFLEKGVRIGIGDDCAVLDYDDTRYLLWAVDMLIEGTHFKTGKASYKKIGQKAVAVNISDIAAMGGTPKYILVSFGAPFGIKTSKINAIYDGIFDICRKYGISIVGGNTARSSKIIIDISIIGFVEKNRLIRRAGAKKGDAVLITGPIRNGKKEHLNFVPRLKEACFLTKRYKVNAMIDTSDGIALDIRRICNESRTGACLYEGAIPLSKGLSLEDALYYGESFELLFTMNVKAARKLFIDLRKSKIPPEYFVIGEITDEKEGLTLIKKEGQISKLYSRGYEHL